MFLVCKASGPQSSISEEVLHSTILRPKKPLGRWNRVNLLLREWMNVLPDYNPWTINLNPYNTKLSQQKNSRFDRNNLIMSWEQKKNLLLIMIQEQHIFHKVVSEVLCTLINLESEINDFEPRVKSAENRFQLSSVGLNLETLNTILSGTTIFEPRLKIKPLLKFFKFCFWFNYLFFRFSKEA